MMVDDGSALCKHDVFTLFWINVESWVMNMTEAGTLKRTAPFTSILFSALVSSSEKQKDLSLNTFSIPAAELKSIIRSAVKEM